MPNTQPYDGPSGSDAKDDSGRSFVRELGHQRTEGMRQASKSLELQIHVLTCDLAAPVVTERRAWLPVGLNSHSVPIALGQVRIRECTPHRLGRGLDVDDFTIDCMKRLS